MTDHLGFVVAAYAVTFGLLLATVAWLLGDYVTQRRMLERLDGRRRENRRP
jgi:heme exporter protein CcmD